MFGISNNVCIKSKNYQFKFEKKYWETINSTEGIKNVRYPWYIIPIWLSDEELDSRVLDKQDKVYFLLQEINYGKINEELNDFFSYPQVLLFLRNIDKITLAIDSKVFVLSKTLKDQFTVIKKEEHTGTKKLKL